jgi:hypothetical protein
MSHPDPFTSNVAMDRVLHSIATVNATANQLGALEASVNYAANTLRMLSPEDRKTLRRDIATVRAAMKHFELAAVEAGAVVIDAARCEN